MAYTRTAGGLAEKWRFHKVPTIWVEGPTDIYFYGPLLDGKDCRVEPFHGITNCTALVDAVITKDYPHIVILDGDYEILKGGKSSHRRIIVLSRYSFENFLWEGQPANKACLRHARCGEQKDLIEGKLDALAADLETSLRELVAYDIAARRMDPAPDVLPAHIDNMLSTRHGVALDKARVAALLKTAKARIDKKAFRKADKELGVFLKERPLVHILNGHLVLGILRKLFVLAAEQERGSGAPLSNDAFTQLLADAVWRRKASNDHTALKRRINAAVKEVSPEVIAMAKKNLKAARNA
jgi:hypothetical protein